MFRMQSVRQPAFSLRGCENPGVSVARLGPLIAVGCALVLAGCGLDFNLPDGSISVTNRTAETIRLTGSCVPDDAETLEPGDTDTNLYAGADCRVDNGDGLDGVLGCLTLTSKHTDLTMEALRPVTGRDDCWGSGSR